MAWMPGSGLASVVNPNRNANPSSLAASQTTRAWAHTHRDVASSKPGSAVANRMVSVVPSQQQNPMLLAPGPVPVQPGAHSLTPRGIPTPARLIVTIGISAYSVAAIWVSPSADPPIVGGYSSRAATAAAEVNAASVALLVKTLKLAALPLMVIVPAGSTFTIWI